MLLISPSPGKLHQMHLLGNGAQRELLTSRLLKRRLNYRASPDLMICCYYLRNNAVFYDNVWQLGGNKSAKWKHQQWRTVWRWVSVTSYLFQRIFFNTKKV